MSGSSWPERQPRLTVRAVQGVEILREAQIAARQEYFPEGCARLKARGP